MRRRNIPPLGRAPNADVPKAAESDLSPRTEDVPPPVPVPVAKAPVPVPVAGVPKALAPGFWAAPAKPKPEVWVF